MEIPVIDTATGMEEIPSFLPSRFLSVPVTQTYVFFKWGALVLVLVASFTTLIKGIKILILNKSQHNPFLKQPLVGHTTEEEDFSDSDSDSDDDLDEPTASSDGEDERGEDAADEDYSVRGSFNERWRNRKFTLRRRRNGSLLDLSSLLTTGKNVVKLWDNNHNNNNNVLSSLFSGKVVVSAERSLSGKFLKVWDSRVGCWTPRLGLGKADVLKVNDTGGVFVRDNVTGGLTVGDVRKAGSPLVGVTDDDVDTWWEADTVIVGG